MKKVLQVMAISAMMLIFSKPVEAKIVKVDFSQVPCCRVLANEYRDSHGLGFNGDMINGFATYQANGFITSLSTATSSAIPHGITKTQFMLDKLASKVSFKIQSGSPFNLEQMRPAKLIKITYYGAKGNVLQTKMTDTCLKKSSQCYPKTVTYQMSNRRIASVSAEILTPYSFSMDDFLADMAN